MYKKNIANTNYCNIYGISSEQQVIDCTGSGCSTGMPDYAWHYLASVGGSEPTSLYYPYVAPAVSVSNIAKFGGIKPERS